MYLTHYQSRVSSKRPIFHWFKFWLRETLHISMFWIWLRLEDKIYVKRYVFYISNLTRDYEFKFNIKNLFIIVFRTNAKILCYVQQLANFFTIVVLWLYFVSTFWGTPCTWKLAQFQYIILIFKNKKNQH